MFIDFNDIMFGIRSGRYMYIGSGSSRRVYDLGNDYVVKIAKNDAEAAKAAAEAAAANAMTNTPEGWTQAVATLEVFKSFNLYKDEDGDICQND